MGSLTLQDLLNASLSTWSTAGAAWQRYADGLGQATDQFYNGTRDLADAWPAGHAADAATIEIDATRAEISSAAAPAGAIATALKHHADGMTDLKQQAESIVQEARAAGYIVDVVAGTVTAPPPPASSVAAPMAYSGNPAQVADLLSNVLARARSLDDATAAAVLGHLPNPTNGFGSLPDTSRPGAILDANAIQDHIGRDPREVNAWWRGLTDQQRAQMIADHPAEIGALDGVPVVDRSTANKILLAEKRTALQNRQDPLNREAAYLLSVIAGDRAYGMSYKAQLDASKLQAIVAERSNNADKLAGLDAVSRRLDAKAGPTAYLLGLSTDGTGRAIVAVGNPDTADNIVTFVPGMGTKLGGGTEGDIRRADVMASDANPTASGKQTAAIMWLGYDAPPLGLEAVSAGDATSGAPALRSFENGLRATHQGAPAHQVVLGHSYGTLVVGLAASGGGGLNANDIIFVASPGVGVDHASDLHLTGQASSAGHVYATTAPGDIIGAAVDPTGPYRHLPKSPMDVATMVAEPVASLLHLNPGTTHWGRFGLSPTDSNFGAQVFASPVESIDPIAEHSAYWDHANGARANIAQIVLGHGASAPPPPPPAPPPAPLPRPGAPLPPR